MVAEDVVGTAEARRWVRFDASRRPRRVDPIPGGPIALAFCAMPSPGDVPGLAGRAGPRCRPDAGPGRDHGRAVQSIGSTSAITGNVTAIFPGGKAVHELVPGSVVAIKPDCTGTMALLPRKKGTSDTSSKETHRFATLRESGECLTFTDEREGGAEDAWAPPLSAGVA